MKEGDKIILIGSVVDIDANSCIVSFPNCEPYHRQILFRLENKPVDVIAKIEERIFDYKHAFSPQDMETTDTVYATIEELEWVLKLLKGETE